MTIPSTHDAELVAERLGKLLRPVHDHPRVIEARSAIHTALTDRAAAVICHTTLTLFFLKILCDMMLETPQTGDAEPAYPWFASRPANH